MRSSLKIANIITIAIMILLMAGIVSAQEEMFPNVPQSWYEAPRTASEMGISQFNQAPMLDAKVEEGELPPVEERLPDDPPVVEPISPGKYGGTLTIWDKNLTKYINFISPWAAAGVMTPDGGKIVPRFIKGWEYSDDYKKITLNLHEGLKFSSGNTLDADDYIYWWKYISPEPTLAPDLSDRIKDVKKVDKWTVEFHYYEPTPNAHMGLMKKGMPGSAWHNLNSDFMKQLHPDFIGLKKANQMAKDAGFEDWTEYYNQVTAWGSIIMPDHKYQRPTAGPYRAVKKTATTLILERNPYYPFIDDEGNQLPYIDRIRVRKASNADMANQKAATGDSDFDMWNTTLGDMPLYKKNAANEDFEVRIFGQKSGSGLRMNLSHPDPKWRALFQDVRFRRAVSLAMNREQINDKLYFGEGIPYATQAPLVGTEDYKEEFRTSYIEYDPESAKGLLDEMGIKDRNDDGYRELPEGTLETMNGEEVTYDGEKFNLTLVNHKPDKVNEMELIKKYLNEIGIDINLKTISADLVSSQWASNKENAKFAYSGIGYAEVKDMRRVYGFKLLAPIVQARWTQWPGWVNWYDSNGDDGMEPPAEIKDLIDIAETALFSESAEERKQNRMKLFEINSEKLWMVGLIGGVPKPIIIKNKVKNFPQNGILTSNGHRPLHLEQLWLNE